MEKVQARLTLLAVDGAEGAQQPDDREAVPGQPQVPPRQQELAVQRERDIDERNGRGTVGEALPVQPGVMLSAPAQWPCPKHQGGVEGRARHEVEGDVQGESPRARARPVVEPAEQTRPEHDQGAEDRGRGQHKWPAATAFELMPGREEGI